MDARLFEAAQTGDINSLQHLLRENPLILDKIALTTTENPLNLASVAGHVGLVKEIIRLKPDFAKEVNQDGFSPLHMAAANGHVEVVRELTKVDPNLCRVEGRGKRTPLHAAIKGRVEVIRVMLSGCPECIDALTVERETALELAVKNNQFEATKVLVDYTIETNKGDVLNLKDEQGSTVLHLAVRKKQRQVIELLLGNGTVSQGVMEVNAMNHNGLTALDVLLMFPSEEGEREIVEILQTAGAMRARDITLSTIPQNQTFASTPTQPETDRSKLSSMVEYFKFKRGRDSPSTARSTLLVIAVLVATATFQVGMNPPGGVWSDTVYATNQNNSSGDIPPHNAGESIMGTTNMIAYDLFIFSNTIGFSVSLFMINILTSRFPLQFELQICLIAMFFTYNTGVINITPNKPRLFVILTTSIVSSTTPMVVKWVRQHGKKLGNFAARVSPRSL